MAFREVRVFEVREVLRLWLLGEGLRSVERLAGVDRKTVRRYVAAAVECGLVRDGGVVQLDDVLLASVCERVRPHRPNGHGVAWGLLVADHDQLKKWLVDDGLTAVKACELLGRRGVVVPERTVQRYALVVLGVGRSAKGTTVRVADGEPGVEVQIDFGKMGLIPDPETGRQRVCQALIFTAVFSRHTFVWLSFTQTTATVIAGCEAAWAFFGGVFKVVIPDYVPRNIIGDQPTWTTPKKLERGDMRRHPRLGVHREHRTHEHVPRARQDHHERPHPPGPPRQRIQPGPQEPVVDLGLFARLHVGPQHRHPLPQTLVGELRRHVPPEAGDTHRQTVLVPQTLMDRGRGVGLQHRPDRLPVDLDRRERQAPGPGVDQLGEPAAHQLRPLRAAQRRAARGDPRRLRLGHILADRLGIHPQTVRHHRLRPARMPVL